MAFATINNGASYFDTTAYTANGGSQTITNSGSMQPDFFWGKVRSTTSNNILINSIVGVSKYLYSNTTASEVTDANYFTSFNSNGFSVGSNNYSNGTTMVAWQWKGGGTGVSNTAGTISSTVSANTTSGFSIVTWTGNGSNSTIGHGLNSVPRMILVKNRTNGAADWRVYHASVGNTVFLKLNTTGATVTASTAWNNTTPTSSVFSVGTSADVNENTASMLAYCFAEVKGYSKIGSYTGNGSTDGTFIYTGFKPSWVLLKDTTTGGSGWEILDNKRNTYNVMGERLYPNLSDAGSTATVIDFLSNGFKLRTSADTWINTSGNTYIYAAFAENPFVLTDGTPVTAR